MEGTLGIDQIIKVAILPSLPLIPTAIKPRQRVRVSGIGINRHCYHFQQLPPDCLLVQDHLSITTAMRHTQSNDIQ
jgi:hypothetical protein